MADAATVGPGVGIIVRGLTAAGAPCGGLRRGRCWDPTLPSRIAAMRTPITRLLAGIALLLLPAATLAAQEEANRFSAELAQRPAVATALAWLEESFDGQVDEWIRITEIPAPSRQEAERAAYVRQLLEAEGLEVHIDSIGNVVARRPGTGSGPTIVLAPHLDTVHPMDTDVTVRRDGDVLRAPGVFDNSAGVATTLQAIRAMNAAGIRTRGDVIFVGTVQEELGLFGMDYWLETNPGVPDMVVVVDGGLGPVMYGALGIYWSRYHFRGAGAHTNRSADSRTRPAPWPMPSAPSTRSRSRRVRAVRSTTWESWTAARSSMPSPRRSPSPWTSAP
jgi:tripeptide aminopeptidase